MSEGACWLVVLMVLGLIMVISAELVNDVIRDSTPFPSTAAAWASSKIDPLATAYTATFYDELIELHGQIHRAASAKPGSADVLQALFEFKVGAYALQHFTRAAPNVSILLDRFQVTLYHENGQTYTMTYHQALGKRIVTG